MTMRFFSAQQSFFIFLIAASFSIAFCSALSNDDSKKIVKLEKLLTLKTML